MTPNRGLSAALALVLVLAGCAALPGDALVDGGDRDPTAGGDDTDAPEAGAATATGVPTTVKPGGWVGVVRVADPPVRATVVPSNHSAVREAGVVRDLLRGPETTRYLDPDSLHGVGERLPARYRHAGDRFGWYVAHQGEVYRVRVVWYPGREPQDSDEAGPRIDGRPGDAGPQNGETDD